MNKSIAFDLDGVLYPWTTFAYEKCRELGFAKTNIEDFFENVFDQVLPKILKQNILTDQLLYYKTLVNNEHGELVKKFDKAGWDIYYITLRPENCHFTTRIWLKNSKLPQYENIFFPDKKSTIIRQYNIQYKIEDREKIVEDVKNFCDVFLVNTYWNRNYKQPSNCIRIDSILELEGYLL